MKKKTMAVSWKQDNYPRNTFVENSDHLTYRAVPLFTKPNGYRPIN